MKKQKHKYYLSFGSDGQPDWYQALWFRSLPSLVHKHMREMSGSETQLVEAAGRAACTDDDALVRDDRQFLTVFTVG